MDQQTPTPTQNNIINTNGAHKKQHNHSPRVFATPEDLLYRECLRNHAASLGGHALDGCGEFMPSPAANPAEPTSLRCAACGCHRNFHRRISSHLSPRSHAENEEDKEESDDIEKDIEESKLVKAEQSQRVEIKSLAAEQSQRDEKSPLRKETLAAGRNIQLNSSISPKRPASGPQMLMDLSHSIGSPQEGQQSRKRFRTKFRPEQKEKMQELSERLGWRMQKRDEGMVEEWCKDIGVNKSVFKVWMHNNKQHFYGAPAGQAVGGAGIQVIGNGNGSNGHVINASSSSS